ncbi:MAG: alpha-2-macroglobulin, partial [Elusimicrobia bacterium]|nr:alpha-2-macroglobulin [Elusimicrobiota bacterium]
GVPVAATLVQRKLTSHRKRLVGGFYAYEHSERLIRLGAACPGKTDARGLLACEAPSPVSGNVILQATVQDEAGRESTAHEDLWVAGEGDWWFAAGDNDRIDVIAERNRYEPGETASLQVRTPFAEATALVTVEREGVLETFVRKLSRKNPVVRVPVKGHYAPNVFVSVLVVRGRVGDARPTALVDLGRPAYKLGVGELRVGWRAHELKVEVSADREVYRVREKAKVKLRVREASGKALPPGAEAAVAAVDEGLLELMPNKSWGLLEAMMGRRATAVRTATAQMHVVGKRHYGLKALPPGGGGGRQTTRELFDTLLLWKARVPLNAQGEALLEVPLNDSLTGFKIVAVAHAGAGLFGSGATSIRATQDLQLLAGMPPVVREGDRFQAGLTVRNATDRPMELEVSAKAEGLGTALAPLTAAVGPNGARELSWDVAVPAGVSSLAWEVSARDKSGAEDRLKFAQKVVPAVPVRTLQATISQVDGRLETPVRLPPDAIAGRGGVQVSFRPTLGGGLEGLAAYMGTYPYECLEQKVSRAVALGDVAAWDRAMAELPSYLDSDGLAKYFPTMTAGSDCLTSYVLAIGHEAGWRVPEGAKERMRQGLTRFVEGKVRRDSSLPAADLTLRKLSAIEALSREGHAQPGWLPTLTIEPNLWPTSSVLDWAQILKRVEQAPERERRLEEASRILRSRLNFQGTTLGFSTEASDALWWLMVSNDVNAVRMLLAFLDDPAWREDVPRLIRGAVGRQRRGHWDLTVANAWGRLSLEKFSKAFESTPVSGASRVSLAGAESAVDWGASPAGETLTLPWPAGPETVSVRHEGEGKPWATVSSLAAVPLQEPFSSGYKIKKTWTAVERKTPGRWTRGDIARVRLELEAQADRTWVVVDDPIPAGASVLGTGLGRDSSLATQGERASGWVWPAFEERSFTAFRAYYELVPKGPWTVEYTLRLNNDGVFQLPATRVEAMYSPEMFGELPNPAVEVAR